MFLAFQLLADERVLPQRFFVGIGRDEIVAYQDVHGIERKLGDLRCPRGFRLLQVLEHPDDRDRRVLGQRRER